MRRLEHFFECASRRIQHYAPGSECSNNAGSGDRLAAMRRGVGMASGDVTSESADEDAGKRGLCGASRTRGAPNHPHF